jgi:hypothetical protein
MDNDLTIPTRLRELLGALLDTYDVAVTKETKEIKELRNYLVISNNNMKAEIDLFIRNNSDSASSRAIQNIGYIVNSKNSVKSNDKAVREGKISENEKRQREEEGIMLWSSNNDTSNEYYISNDSIYNSINFVKEYSANITKIFPQIITKKVDYTTTQIPKYWGFSEVHQQDISKKIGEYYSKLRQFYDTKTIQRVLNAISSKTKNLLMLINGTLSITEISYKDTNVSSIFDKRTSMLLFQNYFLLALVEYINLTDEPAMIVREMNYSNEFNLDVEDDETEGGEELRFIRRGEQSVSYGEIIDLKNKVAKLLVVYLIIMDEHKKMVSLSYSEIMDVVFKTKEREKDTFTDRLKALTDEERTIDTRLKKNKLGVWSKGLQKGLTTYVKESYDEEREAMEKLANIEREILNKKNGVNNNNMGQFVDDYLEEQGAAEDIEKDEYGMEKITEDYMDGNPYGDEEENQEEYD